MHRPKHFFGEIVTHRWRGHFLQSLINTEIISCERQKRFKPLRWTEWLTWAKKMEPNETFMNRVTEICPHSSKTFLTTSKSSVSDKAIFSKLYLFKTLLTDLRKTPNEIIWRKTFQTQRLAGASPHTTPSPIDRVWSLIQMEKVNK